MKQPSQLTKPKKLTTEESAEWRRIKPLLEEVGYCDLDEYVLRAYLAAVVTFRAARKEVAEHGVLVRNGKVLQANPALAVMRQASELLKKLAQELAFSPGARRRLKLELESDGEDGNTLDL